MRAILRASLLIGVVCVQQAQAQQFQYAAKFVIGTSNGQILAPGRYFTAINVHNPRTATVNFTKRFAIARPNEQAGPLSASFTATLPGLRALEIDTLDIHQRTGTAPGTFVKGFVIIT